MILSRIWWAYGELNYQNQIVDKSSAFSVGSQCECDIVHIAFNCFIPVFLQQSY